MAVSKRFVLAVFSRLENAFWTGSKRYMSESAWSDDEREAYIFGAYDSQEALDRATVRLDRLNRAGWDCVLVGLWQQSYQPELN